MKCRRSSEKSRFITSSNLILLAVDIFGGWRSKKVDSRVSGSGCLRSICWRIAVFHSDGEEESAEIKRRRKGKGKQRRAEGRTALARIHPHGYEDSRWWQLKTSKEVLVAEIPCMYMPSDECFLPQESWMFNESSPEWELLVLLAPEIGGVYLPNYRKPRCCGVLKTWNCV